MARIRYRDDIRISGRLTYLKTGHIRGPNPLILGRQYIQDEKGLRDRNNPLFIHKRSIYFEPINGENEFFKFEDYIPNISFQNGQAFDGYLEPPETVSDGMVITKCLAGTNPSRPVVSLPVSIAELREVPSLMKWAGEKMIRRGPAAFLSYQFGWKPLISDIFKSVDFQAQFDKRANEIGRLYSKSGLKRRLTIHKSVMVLKNQYWLLEQEPWILMRGQKAFRTEVWATVRWRPTTVPKLSSRDSHYRDLARGVVTGLAGYHPLRPDFAGIAQDAWNLMPWSWMLDWWGNAGDFLGAHRNTIPASHGEVCVMRKVDMEAFFEPYQSIGLEKTQGGKTVLTSDRSRRRSVGSVPQLAAAFPFMARKHVSILGALGIMRIPLKHRFK